VPLDGSQFAEHALPHALAIARRTDARVRLVHVHSLSDCVSSGEPVYSQSLIRRLLRENRQYVRSLARDLREATDVRISGLVIESSDIASSLTRAAEGGSLVVMATHARCPAARLLRRSVAHELTWQVSCPVLLVRGSDSAADLHGDPMPRHILVPLDGTRHAESIFDVASSIGRAGDAHITLARFRNWSDRESSSDELASHRYMFEVSRRLREKVQRLSTYVSLSAETVPKAIVTFASDSDVDLIALAANRRGRLARMLGWSVADSVVRRTATPVLIYRP
jgi:nucleotide-binding universal stress UspA family protein